MAKNDFDIDFDFEKEYGFDPKEILDSDSSDEELDFSEFSEEDVTLDSQEDDFAEDDLGDFDFSSLGLDEEFSASAEPEEEYQMDFTLEEEEVPEAPPSRERYTREEPVFDEEEEDDFDLPEEDDFDDFGEDDFDDFDDDEDLTADMRFRRRRDFFDAPEPQQPQYQEEAQDDFREEIQEEPEQEEDAAAVVEEKPTPRRRASTPKQPREKKEKAPREPIKLTVPPFLMKLYKLYFPSMEEINPPVDPNETGKRRRRKSKVQIFKEAYLPAILAVTTLVLVLVFCVGSLRNFIGVKQLERQQEKLEAQQESMAADAQAEEAERLLAQAEIMAQGYDYQGAIDLLETFSGGIENNQDMATKKAEYLNAKGTLTEFKDPSLIPNLSFHVLIADPVRAFSDEGLGGQYNRNFVTIEEFEKILDQLYKNDYVLVDFDSFVSSNTSISGEASYFADPILLPQGKKPIMITETMVNYFTYMIDSNGDLEADAGGDGVASKLVVDANGDIRAEYVDANNQTQVGNYDLVPILEDFIKAHPDFSYRGARAILAVCGYDGVFGYRVNSSFVPNQGQAYVDQQIAAAKVVVQALKDKGYTIACYTYDNIAYGDKTAVQIQADLQSWNSQIAPVVGEVDTIVFARTSDIGDYSGNKFEQLYNAGFRFFVKNAEDPYAEVNNTYVRQSRLMVTGNSMQWKSNQFTKDGIFDPNVVLDVANRGDVPNG